MKIRKFTLMELLLGVICGGLLLSGMSLVFYRALSLREKAGIRQELATTRRFVERELRQSLEQVMVSDGPLGGVLKGEKLEENGKRKDRLVLNRMQSVVTDRRPDAVKQVEFFLDTNDTDFEVDGAYGWTLLRSGLEHVLSSVAEEVDDIELADSVESFELAFWDGEIWQDSWDSEALEGELPLAIEVNLGIYLDPESGEESRVEQLRMVIPIIIERMETGEMGSGTEQGGR